MQSIKSFGVVLCVFVVKKQSEDARRASKFAVKRARINQPIPNGPGKVSMTENCQVANHSFNILIFIPLRPHWPARALPFWLAFRAFHGDAIGCSAWSGDLQSTSKR